MNLGCVMSCLGLFTTGGTADDQVSQAVGLLDRCPSYEMLCMMTVEPGRFRTGYASEFLAACPRPLSECHVETIYDTFRELDQLPTPVLRQAVKKFMGRIDLLFQNPKAGSIAFRQLSGCKEEEVGYVAHDHKRRAGALMGFLFAVPKGEMYPWKLEKGALRLHPSEHGLPFMLKDSYLGVGVDLFDEYARKYGRRNPRFR